MPFYRIVDLPQSTIQNRQGGLAQLVERCDRTAEVRDSSSLSSTLLNEEGELSEYNKRKVLNSSILHLRR
jgi:hypothetical protein